MVWGIVSIVLGALGLFAPAIFAWVVGGAGIVFGVIGIIIGKDRERKFSIGGTVLCVLIIIFSFRQIGSVFEPEKSVSKGPFYLGDKVEFKKQTLTVNSAQRPWQSTNEYDRAKAGKEYVIVNVTIENTSHETISFNPYDFKIRDSNGIETNTAFTSDPQDRLSSGDLAPSGRVTGNLVFEISSGEICPKIVFVPAFFSKDGTPINLCYKDQGTSGMPGNSSSSSGETSKNVEGSTTPTQNPVMPVPQEQPTPVVTVIQQNANYDTSGNLHVTGQVQNTGTSEATFVKAIVTCYDAYGKVVKVQNRYTQPDTIPPGGVASFEVEIYADQGIQISTYTVGVGM